MNFRVVIQPDAEAEVEEAFNYIAARSRDYAVPWLRGLYKAVATLEKFPTRCGVAPRR